MSKVIYLDPIGGVSGDMFSAAFIDAGVVSVETLGRAVRLVVPDAQLNVQRETRNGICGTRLRMVFPQGEEMPQDAHSGNVPSGQNAEQPHCPYRVIHRRLSSSHLELPIKNLAISIFERLAKAEAHIHGKKIDEVVFHEIGQRDAIADVICAAVCIHEMGNAACVSGVLPMGEGKISFSHGTMTCPAPAALEILKGAPIASGYPVGEMTTPTGAAIVATWASSFQSMPALVPEAIGYGYGSRNPKGHLSFFRVIIGEELKNSATGLEADEVMELTANVDDQPPHLLAPALDLFLKEGALDAFFVPYIGKKGRQGQLWSVLVRPEDVKRMVVMMMKELGTIGVRIARKERCKLRREEATLVFDGESVRAKRVFGAGIDRIYPEADDLLKIAREKGLSPIEIMSKSNGKAGVSQNSLKRKGC